MAHLRGNTPAQVLVPIWIFEWIHQPPPEIRISSHFPHPRSLRIRLLELLDRQLATRVPSTGATGASGVSSSVILEQEGANLPREGRIS